MRPSQPGSWVPRRQWARRSGKESGGDRWRLTGTAPAVLVQPEASLAGALEGAGQVGAVVLTAASAGRALVHICGQTRAAGASPAELGGSGGPYCPALPAGLRASGHAHWVMPLPQPTVRVTVDAWPEGGQAGSSQGCQPHPVRDQ